MRLSTVLDRVQIIDLSQRLGKLNMTVQDRDHGYSADELLTA